MRHYPCQPKVTKAESLKHVANAQQKISEAISEINRSLLASEFSSELRQLYNIEDIFWQYATSDKRREVSERSCARYSAITAADQRDW